MLRIVQINYPEGQMLKYIPLIVLLVFVTGCAGGLTQISESEKTIKIFTEVPGLAKEQIVALTRNWMEENFTSQAAPIVAEDMDAGMITGKGQLDYPCSWLSCLTKGDWNVYFDMRIEAQDGIVKTTFRNIHLSSPSEESDPAYSSGMHAPVWSKRDMDAIRPLLTELNNELVNDLRENKAKK